MKTMPSSSSVETDRSGGVSLWQLLDRTCYSETEASQQRLPLFFFFLLLDAEQQQAAGRKGCGGPNQAHATSTGDEVCWPPTHGCANVKTFIHVCELYE